MDDIASTLKGAKLPPLPDKETWLEQRKAAALAFASGEHGSLHQPQRSPACCLAAPASTRPARPRSCSVQLERLADDCRGRNRSVVADRSRS